jgi:predicted unusual protein kinase regulating ubiquinone biosynthesis (AarF/ABC1/UbiB family)
MPALCRPGSKRCRSMLAGGPHTAVPTAHRVAGTPDRLGSFDCRGAGTSIPLRGAAGVRRRNTRAELARFRDATASLARSSQMRLQLAQPDRIGAMSDQSASQTNGAERHLAEIDGNSLARSAFRRGARLASLPLGFAGRATLGLGRRLGGAPADEVSEQLQQRAAEQLFRVLGELKGGAMKFGQALSLFESVLPEDVAAPYRVHLARLQDAAPPMPTSRVHAVLARELGPRWRKSFTDFDPLPAAAASIGQVHQATWSDGRTVAVKVQYPGADEALRSDLKQIGRLSKVFAPLAGGMDVSALVDELTARVTEELDYTLEADSQHQAAVGFADSEEFCVPPVLASTSRVMVSEWVEGAPLSSAANLPDDERNAAALQYVRFLFAGPKVAGLLHADPHPGNFKLMEDGRLGVVDFGLVARLPDGLPPAMGRILRIAQKGDAHQVAEGLHQEGFVASDIDAEDLLDYLSPFVTPAAVPEFQFNRNWMREQFIRVRDPHASGGVAMKLNLPPSYLLIHRVWLGGLAVLSQLNARAAFGEVLNEFLPGYAED